MRMGAFKHVGIVSWCIAIAVCIGLSLWSGIDAIGDAIASAGWGLPFVVLTRAVTVAISGVGWWLLYPTPQRVRARVAVLIRFVREAVNALMPLTQVGGDVIGARLLTFWAIPGPLAAAGVVVDVLIQAVTLILFAACGLVMLVALGADMTVAKTALASLAVAAAVVGGLYLAQRGSARRILHVVLGRLGDGNWRALGTVDAVYRSFSVIYARWPNLLASSALHMAGWLIGVAEVLIGLSYMGHPVSLGEALVIESLIHVVRGAAFAIPSALGAQEAGLIVLCGMFGIPPDEAFALSLMKRAADVVIGLPGLVSLQVLEGRRLRAT
ncbi:MAG: flippase-like domain-containing protein [Xanthobacteraceae bacterium]|nr:flippase-like domain-containing protein [Xanthobacteraceae bacterium]